MFSLIIPVYKNEDNIPPLLDELEILASKLSQPLEVNFVVDGSPDKSFEVICKLAEKKLSHYRVIKLSRNFGSFAAIRAGLQAAQGKYFGIIAADLQEPPELAQAFFEALSQETVDLVIGTRVSREDPLKNRILSTLFWKLYRWLVFPEIPPGGVDIFGCNQKFRDELLKLNESHSSLIGQIFWLGFRRKFISYERRKRLIGKSAWSFKKRWNYLLDSCFSFTKKPIGILTYIGLLSLLFAFGLMTIIIISKLSGSDLPPGYSMTAVLILFFGGLNTFGIGLIGNYVWRTFENTKHRPDFLIQEVVESTLE